MITILSLTASLLLLSLDHVILNPTPAIAQPTASVAQLFYPPANNPQTFMVVGKGKASQKADVAVLEFPLNPCVPTEDEPSPATRENLSNMGTKEIINALRAIGVAEKDIQVTSTTSGNSSGSSLPFPFPFPGSEDSGATKILVTVQKPTHDRLQQIIKTASNTANKTQQFALGEVGVRYSVSECQALQQKTYQNAIENAQKRAAAMAAALGVELNPIPSIAEPFYDVYLPDQCTTGGWSFFSNVTATYNPNDSMDVAMSKEIFLTFSVR